VWRISDPSVSEGWPFGKLRAILSEVEGWQAVGVGPHRKKRKDDKTCRQNCLHVVVRCRRRTAIQVSVATSAMRLGKKIRGSPHVRPSKVQDDSG
jgi:hypothetical protein